MAGVAPQRGGRGVPVSSPKTHNDTFGGTKRTGGEPEDEAEHYYVCDECGQAVDMRDIAQVLHHEDAGHGRWEEEGGLQ